MTRDTTTESVTRTPQQPAGGRITYDGDNGGFTIDEIHPLFDVPVDTVASQFLAALEEQAADKTWANDYDDLDVMMHKCEQAIQDVLDIDHDVHEGCVDVAVENIYSTHPDSWSTWDGFALSWLGHYLTTYNSMLNHRTPDAFDDLLAALDAVQEDTHIENETLLYMIAGRLGQDDLLPDRSPESGSSQ